MEARPERGDHAGGDEVAPGPSQRRSEAGDGREVDAGAAGHRGEAAGAGAEGAGGAVGGAGGGGGDYEHMEAFPPGGEGPGLEPAGGAGPRAGGAAGGGAAAGGPRPGAVVGAIVRLFPELAEQLVGQPGRGPPRIPHPPNVDERRGVVRPWEAAMEAPPGEVEPGPSSRTVALMNRSRLECVGWQDVWEDFVRGDMFLREKYTFEQLRTYWVHPNEDLGQAIARHCKVALHPDQTYRVRSKIFIQNCCYVIGNGATVVVETSERVAFHCGMQQMCPAITGMFGCTFTNIRFTCDSNAFRGTCIMANTSVLVHGCQFMGFPGDCVVTNVGGRIRGCVLTACFKGILNPGRHSLSVSKCIFDKCIIAVSTMGFAKIRHNYATECTCFLLCRGVARIQHNTVQGPFYGHNYRMVTCGDGTVQSLRPIHVVAHPRRQWPVFEHNVLIRTSVYLGCRRGMFVPRQCQAFHVNFVLDHHAATQVSISGLFDMSVQIYRVLRMEERRQRMMHCECGEVHQANGHILGICTEDMRLDPLQHSVARTEFSSSEDEAD
ncbi:E1B 55K [Squirrel monkey adenovirus]|nr:E1B 55K [Squirrel monkey adenovirus]